MFKSYEAVCERIGISGRSEDDLKSYFNLDNFAQPALPMDSIHTYLYREYRTKSEKLNKNGLKLGRSRLAVLSEAVDDRLECNFSGNCLFGCIRRSMYSAAYDLDNLRKKKNFFEVSGVIIDKMERTGENWSLAGKNIRDGGKEVYSSPRIVLAAGTLATTRIALSSLGLYTSRPLLSCPSAAFLLWVPKMLGTPNEFKFALGQLSYSLDLDMNINGFGSIFPMSGILPSEIIRHVPMTRRYAIDLIKALQSSCVVGNLFLPGNLSNASLKLSRDGYLNITGNHSNEVDVMMKAARKKLTKFFFQMKAIMIPGSFKIGQPGIDVHYAGTLPMRDMPKIGETSRDGEVKGLKGVYVADGACLPYLSSKSHTLTIMANADRIGNLLARKYKK